tara:strand:- start:14809 stop:16494 length:1686 start_codon:yes stop_codon:yes gene_type:complete
MKFITKALYFSLISLLGFMICNYFLGVVFIELNSLELKLGVTSNSIDSLEITYNVLPTQFDAKVYKRSIKDKEAILLTLNSNKQIKAIYAQTKGSGNISLSSIKVVGFIKDIIIPFNEIDSSLSVRVAGGENRKFLTSKEFDNIELNKKNVVVIGGKLFDKLYYELQKPIITISFIFSILVFLTLILFSLRSSNLFFQPNESYFLTTIFIVIIFGFFFSRKEVNNIENRQLALMPSFDQNIWRIPNKYVQYFNDHFPARVQFSRINNFIKIKYFKTSPNPNFVQIGTDGWLFYSTKKIRKVYQGSELYSENELISIKKKIELKQTLLSKRNIEFYLIIPPLKHSIYPEYLPTSLKPAQEFSKRDQVMEFLKENSSIKIIDPYKMLLELKNERQIYYKTDTHWNQVGGFETYKMLINRIRKDFPSISEPYSLEAYEMDEREDYEGDLIDLLNLKGHFSRQGIFLTPKFEVKAEAAESGSLMGNEVKVDKYTIPQRADLPKLLMYRDSFTSYLKLPLSNHFFESTFIWDRNLNVERIDQEKPDIIVLEMMERFVDHLLTENEK